MYNLWLDEILKNAQPINLIHSLFYLMPHNIYGTTLPCVFQRLQYLYTIFCAAYVPYVLVSKVLDQSASLFYATENAYIPFAKNPY